jgi:tyrosyl-tRNA synthetase
MPWLGLSMNIEKRFELIKRNTEEIVTEDELKRLLEKKKHPVVYCGYEPSGPLHLGHFVTINKLIDFAEAGFKVKILLANVHAFLNRKGDEPEIKKQVETWKRTIKLFGLNADIVLGGTFQLEEDYQIDMIRLAQHITINRGLRSMQEIARDVNNATVSQLIYPLMQVIDIKHLGVDVALGGIEQRKVHMIGKDMEKILKYKFIAVHTPLISSLRGPKQKMSSSVPETIISFRDNHDEIKNKIKNSYCPEKKTEGNPLLQLARLIIFPKIKEIEISRSEKFGGDIKFSNYAELEAAYKKKELHPLDLKNAVVEYLDMIIAPIRKKLK